MCKRVSREASRSRILLLVALLASLATLLGPPPASAHPLGQNSINHLTLVRISSDRIALLYILDQAEFLTLRQRDLTEEQIIAFKLEEVQRRLSVIVDGERRTPRSAGDAEIDFTPGVGGLPIMRLELPLEVRVSDPRRVEIRDLTYTDFPGLIGIKVGPGTGTAVRVTEDTSDPTDNLRTYEGISRADIPANRRLKVEVKPGPGIARGPNGEVLELQAPPPPESSSGDAFTRLFEDAAQGEGVFIAFLLAAFAWGALHALSPGHGKAMVAAYLVGTRGTPRHAVALGGIVTATHTIGVFALGLVTLLLAQFILPEDLYPWLNLAAGLLIVGVGVGVLRSRIRWARRRGEGGVDEPPPGPDQGHAHPHADHGHGHHHHHHRSHGHEQDPEDVTWPGLLGMGISAGLIPCPSALVVLLAAISQHEIGFGLVLIVAFSLGLAATLTALGLSVVYAKRIGTRISSPQLRSSAIVRVLPLASNLVILVLGLVLTVKAVPDL